MDVVRNTVFLHFLSQKIELLMLELLVGLFSRLQMVGV